jgi:hypothetical protein
MMFRRLGAGRTRRQLRRCAVLVCVLVVAGCGSAATTKGVDTPSLAADPGPTDTPAATAAAPGRLTFSLPLTSAKGYHGTLTFDSPPPEESLGAPGRISVGALSGASGMVSNETTDAAAPYLAAEGSGAVGLTVYLAWKLPPALAQEADIPVGITGSCPSGCENKGSYLLEQVALEPAGREAVQVAAGQPVALLPVDFPGLSTAALGDRLAFAFANGSARAVPDFPEADRAELAQLLAQPPDIIYLEDGYSGGFRFGGAVDDPMQVACHITPPGQLSGGVFGIHGVIDGHTGQPLSWPASHVRAGQPCHSTNASP